MRISDWSSDVCSSDLLTYKTEWLGDDASLVTKLPAHVTDALKGAERPMLIFGGGALSVPGVHGAGLALAKSVNAVKDGWNGYNVVHFSAARMGSLMLGYGLRSEEHTSELQSLMRISYAVFCLKQKNKIQMN